MHMGMCRFTGLTNAFGKKVKKSLLCSGALFQVLQLRTNPQEPESYLRYDRRDRNEALGEGRILYELWRKTKIARFG